MRLESNHPESKVRVRALFFSLVAISIGLFVSACTSGEYSVVQQAELEATVDAMVEAKLQEPTDNSSSASSVDDATPEPVSESDDVASGAPMLITPTPDRSAEINDYLVLNTRHFKGDPEAPITMIEFSDFQCPYCQRFASGAGAQIQTDYIDNGDVRFGYVHFAFLGDESIWAAAASECAAEQDKFWEYHDALFEAEGAVKFSKENLKLIASDLELDGETFNECVDSGRTEEIVRVDSTLASQIGIRSTPSFAINGQPVQGALPYEQFQSVLNAVLRVQ